MHSSRLAIRLSVFALTATAITGCANAKRNYAPTPLPPVANSKPPEAKQVQLVSAQEPLASPQPQPVEVAPKPLGNVSVSSQDVVTYPIDLPTALQLADGSNFQIAIAREQVQQAFAKANYAQTLWLPSLRTGVNFNHHEGQIQDIQGHVFNVNRSNLYTGLGAGTPAAGSPSAPGLYANFHLADAFFGPLAARQAAGAKQCAAVAATNDGMFRAALGYIELLRAAEDVAIAERAKTDALQLAELTSAYAKSGQGLQSDADRASTELSIRGSDALRSQEAFQVASARLAQILRLDPLVLLQPIDPVITPFELVTTETPVGELVTQALCARAELAESRFLVEHAVQKMKREHYACLVPSVVVGASFGGFGGGTGDTIGNFNRRFDADAVAYWELRNLGFGDQAQREDARSQVQQACLSRGATMDQIAREIVEASTQANFRRQQISIAKQAVETAESAHQRNLDRIQGLQGLPIEVLQSNQALAQSRREYLRAVTDYNLAQFALYRALGWPGKIPPNSATSDWEHLSNEQQ
jgi:outer membrane protein TolC